MLERIERLLGHPFAPPLALGALLGALDVGLVVGVFAMALFVVTLEAVKDAARGGRDV